MDEYFYAVDISRDEKLVGTPSYVDKFLVEPVCEDHRNENRTSLTARMQHAKSRSMPRKNDTVCWEETMSVTERQADMVPAFQGMSANPDLEYHADAVFGICDGLRVMSISPDLGTRLLIDLA